VVYLGLSNGVPDISVVGDAISAGVSVSGEGKLYDVFLPNKVQVRVSYYGAEANFFQNVYITLPLSMLFRVVGLGGYFNMNPADDYMLPTGALTEDEDEFHQSWRVPSGENLFLDAAASIPDISSSFPDPGDGQVQQGMVCSSSEIDQTSQFQQMNGSSPFTNEPVPFNPNYTVPTCDTMNMTLKAEAEAACGVYFNDSVAECCKQFNISTDGLYTSCICDYVLSQGPAFLFVSVDPFYEKCNEEADRMNTTCEPCPSACNGQGTCMTGGICNCDSGFLGDDCSEDWSKLPIIVTASQTQGLGCPREVSISGNHFYGTNLQCIFGATVVNATKINIFQLVCPIPPASSPGATDLGVTVMRSDGMLSSEATFSSLPSCCEGLCQSGSVCSNGGPNGFTCSCHEGFSGDLCEVGLGTESSVTTTVSLKVSQRRYSGSAGPINMTLAGSGGRSQPLELGSGFADGEELTIFDLTVDEVGDLYAIELTNLSPSDGFRLKTIEFIYRGIPFIFGKHVWVAPFRVLHGTPLVHFFNFVVAFFCLPPFFILIGFCWTDLLMTLSFW